MIGKTISHYKILEKLGEGGMGVVYKAEDTKLKRTVALKFLPPELTRDTEAKKRFIQEAQAAAALVHPNIATVFEFDEWEGKSFIAMEYVEGQTLAQIIKAGPIAFDQATEFTVAIADALSLAHWKGVIHRDIKASSYLWYVDTGLRPEPEYLKKAEELAKKALAINERQPDAIYTLGNLSMKKGKVEEAFKGFSEAAEIDPKQRNARLWRTFLLCISSFFEEALEEADSMLADDPFWPMGHWLHSTIRLFQGMFDASVAEYEQMVADVPSKLVWLALAYRYAGNMDKAWEAAQKVKQLEPEGILWPAAFAFLEGAEGKGRNILDYVDERLKAFGWDFHIVCYWVASFYAMGGEKDEAFRWLERAIEIGNRNYRWFAIDPNLDNIRDDPHFFEMLEKARLAAQKLGKYL